MSFCYIIQLYNNKYYIGLSSFIYDIYHNKYILYYSIKPLNIIFSDNININYYISKYGIDNFYSDKNIIPFLDKEFQTLIINNNDVLHKNIKFSHHTSIPFTNLINITSYHYEKRKNKNIVNKKLKEPTLFSYLFL